MDFEAVRTFLTVAEAGQFSDAAIDLSLTQQAVSKRVAVLERQLGVRLFARTARGVRLTREGETFLPHAKEVLRVAERAAASVRPDRRPLRVDVINRRTGPASLLRDFHEACPDIELDVVTRYDARTAIPAVQDGSIDVTFRAITGPLPDGVEACRVYDEAVQLLVGPEHPLAGERTVRLEQLAGHRIWMPDHVPGTEWHVYYTDLASTFGLTIATDAGPDFGAVPIVDALAESGAVATLIADRTRPLWPAEYDLRCLPITDPTPVYPHSLVWRAGNRHPSLLALRAHFGSPQPRADSWTPEWAQARTSKSLVNNRSMNSWSNRV